MVFQEVSRMKNKREGFSLIELMIAIAILALISVTVGPMVFKQLEKGKRSKAETTLKTLNNGIAMYQIDIGKWPQSLRDLVKKPSNEQDAKKWQKGGYLDNPEVPQDPWGHKYQYQLTPGGAHEYELFSYGSNGKNAPKDEHISLWDLK